MDHPDHIVAGMAEQDLSPTDALGRRAEPADPALFKAGMIVLAAYNLGLAVFMTISPHTFFTSVGPFGELNRHYIRDFATYSAALGFGFLVAIRRPSWRVPVLAIATVQFGLHTVNHLVDASSAHPQWTGWFDFVSLLAGTVLIAWMWRTAARDERSAAGPGDASRSGGQPANRKRPSLSPSPQAERSTT
jgi:hypothetical protein